MPAILVRRVRAAVDRMQERPLLLRIESRRIRHPHLHWLAVPALDCEFTHIAHRMPGEQCAVDRFDRPLAGAIASDREERGRMSRGGAGKGHDAAQIRARETRDAPARHDQRRLRRGKRQPVEADAATVLGQEQKRSGIGTPLRVHRGAVKFRRKGPHLSARARREHEVPLVVEDAVGIAGRENEPLSVGRISRGRVVGTGRRGQDMLAPRRKVNRDDVTLVHEVRFGGQIRGDREFPPIRGDVEVVRREVPGGQCELQSRQQVFVVSGAYIACKHVRLASVGQPVVPEARGAAFRHMRFHF
jgi:hypothetical protein